MKEKKVLITIFGGTGDLAQRKLYPSLFRLYQKGQLKESFAVIGTARRPWSNETYREVVMSSVSNLTASEQQAAAFASHFYYQSAQVIFENSRFVEFPYIVDSFTKLYNEEFAILEGTVITAVPLSAQQKAKLEEKILAKFGLKSAERYGGGSAVCTGIQGG